MPGLLASPNHLASTIVIRHDSVADFLSYVYPDLCRQECSAGIVFAHALKRLSCEAGRKFSNEVDMIQWLRLCKTRSASHKGSSFWITLWSYHGPSTEPSLELVLSCIDWTLGDYPIFLWTPNRSQSTSPTWLTPRISQLVDALLSCVPPERVFTVFGMAALVESFAKRWTESTGFIQESEPVYAAYLSYCTPTSFIDTPWRPLIGHQIRKANIGDLESVARLCKEFADESVYFPLTLELARIEARELIEKGQVWVYNVDGQCSTICAVTRTTFNVSAITKVYTTPKFRKLGCAEHLVRFVTRKLLFDDKKSTVSLYVGYENNAQRVYDRMGFQGLCGKPRPEGVENSLEIGFIGANKGHW